VGDKIQENEMGGACSEYDEWRGVCSFLVWKAGKIRPLWRHRNRREDNIKMNFQEFGCWELRTGSWLFKIGTGGGHL